MYENKVTLQTRFELLIKMMYLCVSSSQTLGDVHRFFFYFFQMLMEAIQTITIMATLFAKNCYLNNSSGYPVTPKDLI